MTVDATAAAAWAHHVRVRVRPEARAAFERAARAGVGALLEAPNFLSRTLLRSQLDPTVCFQQSVWRAEPPPEVLVLPATALAEPAVDEACDVVFDEVAEPHVVADASHPWTFHVTVRVQPGGGPVYERWKVAEGVGQRAARGFIKRSLVRSRVDPHVYYYQSFWEDQRFSHAYSQSTTFTSLFEQLNPAPVFAVPMLREDCDIVLDVDAAHATA